jgi:hypothetical protein
MKSAVLYQVGYLLKDLVVCTYKARGYLNIMIPVIPASLTFLRDAGTNGKI